MTKCRVEDDVFVMCVSESYSISECLNKLGLKPAGGNYKQFIKRCNRLKLNLEHFKGQRHGKSKPPNRSFPLETILIENSNYISSNSLKRRLIQANLLQKKNCEICNIKDSWEGKPLVFQLDHINGTPTDNRLENLRLICPNCHTQTSTFAGRNIKRRKDKNCKSCFCKIASRRKLCDSCLKSKQYTQLIKRQKTAKENLCACGAMMCSTSFRCQTCYFKHNAQKGVQKQTKIIWPPPDEMKTLVWQKSTAEISKSLGVSDVAVAKYCKKHNIQKPTRGYWAKIAAELPVRGVEPP